MAFRKKTKRLIALFLILLMVHSMIPIEVLAQDEPPPTDTVLGDDSGTIEPPVEDPGDGDTDVPTLTDASGSAGGTGDEPGESFTLAASAPDIAGMSGAATYRIPIVVPPKGRGGISPNIALVYNSSLRNGPAGVGFSLDLGSIQRNTKKGLDYSARDFVATINGSTSELVERPDWGTNCFGSKIEGPFMRFCLSTSDANNASWTVTSKDGTQYKYGDSLASRQKNVHGIFRWRLSKVTDTSDNWMQVTYTKDHADHDPYLQRIDFTGNGQALAPTNRVEFTLDPDPRPDPVRSYQSHVAVDTVHRYKSIKIYGDGQLVRQYVLDYEPSPSTSRSLLKSVTQYGSDGTALPAITFGWRQGGENFMAPAPWNKPDYNYQSGTGCFQMADVDGDRMDDVVYEADGDRRSIRVLPSTGQTFQNDREWGRRQHSFHDSNRGFRLADFTGDTRADFMYEEDARYVRVLTSSGTGFADDVDENVRWGSRVGDYEEGVIGFRVADLNLDGKADLVYVRDDDYPDPPDPPLPRHSGFWVLRSNGGSFAQAARWGVRAQSFEDSSRGFYMVDANGDGKADVVYDSDSDESYLRLLETTGPSFDTDKRYGKPTGGYLGSFPVLAPADINNDGLMDFVYEKNDSGHEIRVLINTGTQYVDQYGGRRTAIWDPSNIGFHMADLNSDGLPDLVYESDSNYIHVLLGTGMGNGTDKGWFATDSAWIFRPYERESACPGFRMGDVNGDSAPDIIYDTESDGDFLQVMLMDQPPDLLETIENGIGGTYTIKYAPSSAYDNSFESGGYLPYVVQTVSSIKVDDGNGHISTTNFTYSGGYHDTSSREFRGFEKVKRFNPVGNTVETAYYRGKAGGSGEPDCYKGLVKNVITTNTSSGAKYKEVYNTYDYTTPYGTVKFPRLRRVDENVYGEDGTYRTLRTKIDGYDAYGNVTKMVLNGDTADTLDGRVEGTSYYYDTVNWIVSLSKQAWACAEAAPTCAADDSNNLASTSYTYYAGTPLLKTKKLWLKEDVAASPLYQYSYDGYGNLEEVTDPEGNSTITSYDTISQTYPVHWVQSGTDGYTLDLGSATPHRACGTYSVKTDANGDPTQYLYDGHCRPVSVTRPGDGSAPKKTITTEYEKLANYGIIGTQKIKTYQTVDAATGKFIWKETYFDGLGREIKTRAQGPMERSVETVTVAETDYNAKGLAPKKSIPHFEQGETPRWIKYAYDGLGRLKKLTRPYDSPSSPYEVSIEVTYRKDGTLAKDFLGRQRIELLDGFGRLRQVTEYDGSVAVSAQYKYDPLGNLTMVTDPEGHATTIGYDTLSRKRWMLDPDMGYWTYQYDKNGNLHIQTDARNQTVTFTRDCAGRVTLEEYSASTDTDVSYRYDSYDAGGSNNVKGRLARVTDGSGTTRYYYDDRGRVKEVIRTVDGVAYSAKTEYDSMDRARKITYPDNEQVAYEYDAGVLKKVTNPSTQYEYAVYSDFTALGQVGSVVYGNGASTTYGYYAKSDRLMTMLTTSSSGQLQNLEYEYDPVGNITWINDHIACGQSQHMTYDSLNRLRVWERMCKGSSTPEETPISITYFKDGNIKRNSRVAPANDYVYHSGHVHATTGTTAAPTRYEYDANGNMTKRNDTGTTLTYDTENRVTAISRTGSQVTFTYDHEGNRVKKKVGSTSTTVYVGGLYECANGSCTKHILAGGQRIAWKTATGLFFYHGDHLQGLNKATRGTDGTTSQTARYYPFGEVRTHSGATDYPYKFTGQPLDPESGLYYYGARYYDPFIGRFISPDSIVQAPGDPQTLNRYSYCRNNPFIYTDPTGHIFGIDDLFFVGMILAGAALGATTAAISGGDIGMGALTGAISSGLFMGAHGAIATFGLKGVVAAGVHVGAGMASGAINAAIAGGGPLMGAVTSGISAGVAYGVGAGLQSAGITSSIEDMTLKDLGIQLGARTASGAVVGGISAEMMGGEFGDGAFTGAWTAGYGFIFNCSLFAMRPIWAQLRGWARNPNPVRSLPKIEEPTLRPATEGAKGQPPLGHELLPKPIFEHQLPPGSYEPVSGPSFPPPFPPVSTPPVTPSMPGRMLIDLTVDLNA